MINRLERSIEINNWLIRVRWFYLIGIALVVLAAQKFDKYNLAKETAFYIIATGIVINLAIFLIMRFGKRLSWSKTINVLSYFQIIFELVFFTIIFYYSGGLDNIGPLAFFLPIMSAGFFFGFRSAVIVSILSGMLVASVVSLEFTEYLQHIFHHQYRSYQYSGITPATVYVSSYVVVYLIIGIFSGHVSSLLIKRENLLDEKTISLEQASKYRKNEWKQLDKTAKLLVKRDRELLYANNEMDKKVKELQKSETAMLKAFRDLKIGKIALESEKNRTSAIIENIIDPIIVINKENRIELLNQSAREVFDFKKDYKNIEIDQKDNFPMKNFKLITSVDYDVSIVSEEEGGGKDEEELTMEIGEQEVTYKVVTAKVIDKNKEDLGTMKIFYNLTREKMLDKLKSEFITIAAHQLRTPLSAIKWVIKMILDGDAGELNKEQEDLLKKGYKSNERIITLVNDMLNVSRIEEGRFGYTMRKNDLTEIVDIMLESLSGNIQKKSIKLTYDKDSDFPLLNIDVKKMTLVIQNLVENAIKYSPDHGKINIKMRKDGKFVKIVVKDNGIGIPEADKDKLFSKFYRAENALRLQTEGSGLGLFIVRNIVRKHGGDVSFESEEGVGTKFIVTLPIDFKAKDEKAMKMGEK